MARSVPTASQIRREFIEYFVNKCGHTFVPSSPVVPHDDPTLLFTNAGMNQFKDVFLATGTRSYKRAVNSQKCIRAGGKHNDLEDVGKDTYHHTFFEMLGNWSFGDYFKAEAIEWAWDLLTNVWKLDPARLHATYFQGDQSENLEPDHEARDLWLRYLPKERVHPGSKKDNFWEMGDTGPCGPCSEIHFDQTPRGDGGKLVNAGDPRVIEIWNLVFIQFNRAPAPGGAGKPGPLSPLPAKHVDTGMGFERITRVIQGKTSNYDTDIWLPIFAAIESQTGAHPYRGKLDDPIDIAYRVTADHVRCLTMAITDGARPSNEGRGYVLRRILRRAVRHAHQTLGVKGPLLNKLVPAVVQSLGEAFPELKKSPTQVAEAVREEEEAFLRTLDRGLSMFDIAYATAVGRAYASLRPDRILAGTGVVAAWEGEASDEAVLAESARTLNILDKLTKQVETVSTVQAARELGSSLKQVAISGDAAFKLHDTYGFPIDLTRVMAEERGMTVDVAGFERLMEQARETSRAKSTESAGAGAQMALPPDALARLKGMDVETTQDVDKYHGRPISAILRAIWNGSDFDEEAEDSSKEQLLALITDRTNFYAESGGQVGDTGRIGDVDGDRSEFLVQSTTAIGGYVLHVGRLTRGQLTVGERMQLMIAADRRAPIRANHTATHLLNWALREALGDDVNQKGSLVADDRLRFDFSAPHAMRHAEIERVESLVNERIRQSMRVHSDKVPLATAKRIRGVRAVFGEKYPDPVRVVSIGVPVSALVADPASAEWRQFSIEFCGGTHVDTTDEARVFVVVSEQALAAGVRRIVALTGSAAQAADAAARELDSRAVNAAQLADDLIAAEVDDINHQLEVLTVGAVARHRIQEKLESLRSRIKSLRKTAQAASRNTVVDQARALVERSNGKIIVERVDGADKDSLLAAMDVVRAKRPDAAAMLLSANEIEGKVTIVAAVPKSFIDLGLRAGDWVKQAAAICGGSGGGRPDLAQAGGKDPTKVPAAIDAARSFAQQKIGGA